MQPSFWLLELIMLAALVAAFPTNAATNLPVPFTSQAPTGDWRRPYQDFCEEASVVMAAHFVRGLPMNVRIADLQMKIIKTYEDLVFGRSKDTSAEETASILKNLYQLKNVQTKEIKTAEDMKAELRVGKIIIAPVAGRMLMNIYFTPPGPVYHMLVVKGFDDARNTFVTNDPGTRRGENYSYRQQILFNAIHDWNSGNVLQGKKTIIVVGK